MGNVEFTGDIFPMGVVGIFAALEGKSVEEEAQSLLERECKMMEGA